MKNTNWVSVKDRLPETEGHYLFKRTDRDCPIVYMYLHKDGFGKECFETAMWCEIPQ